MNDKVANEPADWDQLIKQLDFSNMGMDLDTSTKPPQGLDPLDNRGFSQGALTISNVSVTESFAVDASGNVPFITLPNITLQDFSVDHWRKGLQVDGDLQISPSHDVLIGDVSLKNTLSEIQARLNILQPNPGLEQEWNDLRELGERYRALEQEILDKQQVWNSLKKRRAPEIT